MLMSAIERIDDPMMMPRILAVADVDSTRVMELAGRARASAHPALDYPTLEELLAIHRGELDAVIIATPDHVHHEQTIRCMREGLHVYCEDPMSSRIEWARDMVKAARETGKLLQIGAKLRSHPRYIDLRDRVIAGNRALGSLNHASAKYYYSPYLFMPFSVHGSPRRENMAREHGYRSYFEMRNWRFSRDHGLGMVGQAVHLIDTFNAMLQSTPRRIMAHGNPGFLDSEAASFEPHLWKPGKVIACLEYDLPPHLHPFGEITRVTATLELLRGYSIGRNSQSFHGEFAAVEVSAWSGTNRIVRQSPAGWQLEDGGAIVRTGKNPRGRDDPQKNRWLAEIYLQDQGWRHLLKEGVIERIPSNDSLSARKPWESPRPDRRRQPYDLTPLETLEDERNPGHRAMMARNVEPSDDLSEYQLAKTRELPQGQAQLLNFFHAIRSGEAGDLRCPAEEGFRTCVTAIKLLESLESGKPVELTAGDFAI
jgi:predicted dehydrogenase